MKRDQPGRSIGTVSYQPAYLKGRQKTERVPLRLIESDGTLVASAYGTTVHGKTIDEVRAALRELSERQIELTWERIIDISYSSQDGSGTTINLDPTDSDREGFDFDRIREITLKWEIYDVSSPYGEFEPNRYLNYEERKKTPKVRRRNWVECELDEDTGEYIRQKGDHYERARDWEGEWEPGIVLFTPERLTTLHEMQAGLGRIDKAIRDMLEGSRESIGKALDTTNGKLLLGPGESNGRKRKGK